MLFIFHKPNYLFFILIQITPSTLTLLHWIYISINGSTCWSLNDYGDFGLPNGFGKPHSIILLKMSLFIFYALVSSLFLKSTMISMNQHLHNKLIKQLFRFSHVYHRINSRHLTIFLG